jgi:hypothetical protein
VKVVSSAEIRVATLSGAVVIFYPGEEREVADEIGLLALQLGAKHVGITTVEPPPPPASGAVHKVEVKDTPDVEAFQEVAVLDDVVAGIEKLVEQANPEDFKADGTPKASAVNRVVGRTVSTEDREAAWDAFLKS